MVRAMVASGAAATKVRRASLKSLFYRSGLPPLKQTVKRDFMELYCWDKARRAHNARNTVEGELTNEELHELEEELEEEKEQARLCGEDLWRRRREPRALVFLDYLAGHGEFPMNCREKGIRPQMIGRAQRLRRRILEYDAKQAAVSSAKKAKKAAQPKLPRELARLML